MANNERARVNCDLSRYRQHLGFLDAMATDEKLNGAALYQMKATVHEIIYRLEDKKRWLESELP